MTPLSLFAIRHAAPREKRHPRTKRWRWQFCNYGNEIREAAALFASVAHQYDLRDAWLGAAVAYHLHGRGDEARAALVQALSRYAHRTLPQLISDIAAAAGAYGWAALYSSRAARGARCCGGLVARALHPSVWTAARWCCVPKSRQTFSARLPAGWRRGTELRISAEEGEILGGVIQLDADHAGRGICRHSAWQPARLGVVSERSGL